MTTAKLFFGGLDPRVSERHLWEIAQFAGPVESVRLPPSSLVFGGGGGVPGGGAAGKNNTDDAEGAEEKGTKAKPPPQPPPPHAGFGFVVFEDKVAALYCLEMLRDSLRLFGRKCRVELSSG